MQPSVNSAGHGLARPTIEADPRTTILDLAKRLREEASVESFLCSILLPTPHKRTTARPW
jgi:hypothetical protein